jgi:hypothetical protein
MRTAIALLPLVLVACTPDEWRGIALPPGVSVVQETRELHGYSAQLDLTAPSGTIEVEDRFRSLLGHSWEECPRPPSSWFSVVDSDRQVAWIDADTRRLLVLVRRHPEQGQPRWHLGLLQPGEHWALYNRYICEPRDRTLFSPLVLQEALRNCSSPARTRRFEARQWRLGKADVRGQMTADLLCGGYLLGLDESGVVGLLGPADRSDDPYLSYRVRSEARFFESLPAPSEECPFEGWYEIRFDFSLEVPGEAPSVFVMHEACGPGG